MTGIFDVAFAAIDVAMDPIEVEQAEDLLRRYGDRVTEDAPTPTQMAADAELAATWSGAAATYEFRAALSLALKRAAWVRQSTGECAVAEADLMRHIAEGLSEADAYGVVLSGSIESDLPTAAGHSAPVPPGGAKPQPAPAPPGGMRAV